MNCLSLPLALCPKWVANRLHRQCQSTRAFENYWHCQISNMQCITSIITSYTALCLIKLLLIIVIGRSLLREDNSLRSYIERIKTFSIASRTIRRYCIPKCYWFNCIQHSAGFAGPPPRPRESDKCVAFAEITAEPRSLVIVEHF